MLPDTAAIVWPLTPSAGGTATFEVEKLVMFAQPSPDISIGWRQGESAQFDDAEFYEIGAVALRLLGLPKKCSTSMASGEKCRCRWRTS